MTLHAKRGGETVEILHVGDCGYGQCKWGQACVEYKFLPSDVRKGYDLSLSRCDHVSRFKFLCDNSSQTNRTGIRERVWCDKEHGHEGGCEGLIDGSRYLFGDWVA